MWHPLLGPSSLALWHGQGQLAGDVAASTCRQTLLGEMGGVTTDFAAQRRDIAYKVHLFHQPELTVCSVVLCATRPVPPDSRVSPEACTTMYSLSLVAPGTLLPATRPLAPIIQDRMRSLGAGLHAWLCTSESNERAVAGLRPELERFLGHVDAWLSLPPLPPRPSIQQTVFGIPRLPEAEKVFLGRAITAFLQMHGTALVRGEPDQLALWLNTLLFLADPKDRHLVRMPGGAEPESFIPDLRLQGLPSAASDYDAELIYNQRAIAVLHPGRQVATIGLPLHIYTCLRQNHFEAQLAKVDKRDGGPAASMEILKQTPQQAVAPLVHQMLELCLGSPVAVREGFLANWRQSLLVLAQGVVSFVDAFDAEQKVLQPFEVSQSTTTTVQGRGEGHAGLQRQLWEGLDLESPEDQRIILALAEGLRPGVSLRVLGAWNMAGALASILLGLESF
eukprot:EG_transcript_7289